VTKNLPPNSRYNILREYFDKIIIWRNYLFRKKIEFHSTNASGPKRIEKMEKFDENSDKSSFSDGKYQIVSTLKIGFNDFISLKNKLIAILTEDRIHFYETEKLQQIGKSSKISNKGIKLSYFNKNLILIGTQKNIEIYDYKNFKIIKSIFCAYPVKAIYINQNKFFIGEEKTITEYEIGVDRNYKQINTFKAHKYYIKDITQVNDGRLITCSELYVKIWS